LSPKKNLVENVLPCAIDPAQCRDHVSRLFRIPSNPRSEHSLLRRQEVKNRIPMLMLAALLAVATGAFAQQGSDQDAPPPQGDQNGPPPMQGGNDQGEHMGHGGRGGRGGRMDPDQQVKALSDKLSLSKDQQSKVRSIYTDQQKQMQSLMQDQSMSREDKRARFEQMRSDTDSQIRSVLTGDQQQKFDTMQKNRQQRMGGRHQHGDQGQAPPNQ
jgi:Spy/CpxP family protein refolding chaperone